jgi:choline dehydrogenase-like flavoprotein
LFANVLEIETDASRRHVRCLHVSTLDGLRFKACAKYFVLATGGIENARLLLLTANEGKDALGNGHDLVGRFFSNHIRIPGVCDLYPSNPELVIDFYKPRAHSTGQTTGVFSMAAKVQREQRLLNLRFEIGQAMDIYRSAAGVDDKGIRSLSQIYRDLRNGKLPGDLERNIANIIADIDNVAVYGYGRLRHPSGDLPLSHLTLRAIAEQSPNPYSRVTLADTADRFGQRKVRLDWRLSELDTGSIMRTVATLAKEVGASGLGRIRDFHADNDLALIGMNHHMGTTRMHNDVSKGVVDENCRVHGVDNLFIAGSSVFPTCGHANPTFTILALAFRLCDHLRGLAG